MENPFKPHALGMFADRETVEEALAFSQQLINGMESTQQAAAWTAVMVLVNTAAKVWDQQAPAQAPAPQAPAPQVTITLSREELGELINTQVKAYLPPLIEEWADGNFATHADDWLDHTADLSADISRWFDDNVDISESIDEWANDNLNDKIENWTEMNLDLETQVKDILRDRVRNPIRDSLLQDFTVRLEI